MKIGHSKLVGLAGSRRRALLALASLTAVLATSAPQAHADVPQVQNGFTYTVAAGNATITDYDPLGSGAPGKVNLAIPSTLGGYPTTRIGDHAFAGAELTGTLSIPDSITTVEAYAFTGNGITSMSLGSSQSASALTTIGEAAFASTGLSGAIALPNSLTTIGDVAFANSGGITAVSFGTSQTAANLSTIGDSAFSGAGLAGALALPNSLTVIGASAFIGNAGITSVSFGTSQTASSLSTIGGSAFSGTGLSGALTLPDSLTSIGQSAFVLLGGLTSVSFESAPGLSQLTTIDDNAFARDSGLSGTLAIPDTVTSIGAAAFQLAGSMTVSLGTNMSASQLTTIGLSAFDFGGANTALEIPDSVTSIGQAAFFSFSQVEQLTIGAGVSSLPSNVFASAPLQDITFTGNAPSSVGAAAFASSHTTTFMRWQGATGWGATYDADGQRFNVAIAAPTVTSVTPDSGPVTGDQEVTIAGTGFAAGASVTMGTSASDVTVVDSRTITVSTPAAAQGGAVDVTVTNLAVDAPLGTGEPLSGSLDEAYTFLPPGPLTFSSGVFPTVLAGATSTLTVTVTNSGGDTLTPSQIDVTGAGIAVTGGTCAEGTPIAAHGTCTVLLAWVPTAAGALIGGELTISYPDGDAPSDSLALTGVASAPQQDGGAASPTVTPVVGPVPTELKPGAGSLLINGVAVPVVVEASPDGRELIVAGGGVRLVLSAVGPDGKALPLAADGSLVVSASGGIPMAGSGFAAGSTVTLYMFSTPVMLGTATARADGTYATDALIPASTASGVHTIQVVGTSRTGQPIALSVGVSVQAPAAAARPTVHAPQTRAPGARFTVEARGVRPRCTVRFWVQGSSATATSGGAGKARAVLTAPTTKGTWSVTARVSGAGCQPSVAKTQVRVG